MSTWRPIFVIASDIPSSVCLISPLAVSEKDHIISFFKVLVMLKLWIDFYVSWTSRNGFHNLIYHINLKLLGENTALHNFVYPLNLPLKINVVDSFHLHLQMMLYVITSTNWDEIKITKEKILRTIDDELFFTNGSVLRFTVFRNNSPKIQEIIGEAHILLPTIPRTGTSSTNLPLLSIPLMSVSCKKLLEPFQVIIFH